MPDAMLRRLRDGTYRIERIDRYGRAVIEDFSTLVAALNADPHLRDLWRAVDRGDGQLDRDILYVVPEGR